MVELLFITVSLIKDHMIKMQSSSCRVADILLFCHVSYKLEEYLEKKLSSKANMYSSNTSYIKNWLFNLECCT